MSLLAVDGGNSKTDVAVVTAEGEVLATARTGGFQPHDDGVGGAVDVLAGAVEEALDRAGRPEIAHIAAYLAGADLPEEEVALRKEILSRGWSREATVGNDTFALLRTGTSRPWGVAVVCGAGINAVGIGPDGSVARFPALGMLSGDWGGGEDVGDAALFHAVRGEDGRGPATTLTGAVAAHFGRSTAVDVVLAVHGGELDRDLLLDLTPVLFAEAAAGDALSLQTLHRLADEVVGMAEVALRRTGQLSSPVEIVLGGGLLAARDPLLAAALSAAFTRLAPAATLVYADAPPILGAALLGLDHLAAAPAAHERLRASWPR
ncbi:N-acetylglucosamine kinase [Actinocorallia longicatena]